MSIYVQMETDIVLLFPSPLFEQTQLVTMTGHVQNVAMSISHLELSAT